jgi:hypothetical protein
MIQAPRPWLQLLKFFQWTALTEETVARHLVADDSGHDHPAVAAEPVGLQ